MEFITEITKNIPNGLYYVAVVYAVWFIAGFYFVRFRDVEKTAGGIEEMKHDLRDVRTTVGKIAAFLTIKNKLHPDQFNSKSPLTLTASSLELLEKTGGKKFVDDARDFLIEQIHQRNPKSPLDAQYFAVSVIFDLVDSDAFTPIKNYIYQNPRHNETQLDVPLMINIIAVYLRDEYFKKYPELASMGQEAVKNEG